MVLAMQDLFHKIDALKSERDFRVLAEQIPAIVYRLQLATGQMDFVSPRIQELGYTPAEWLERAPGLPVITPPASPGKRGPSCSCREFVGALLPSDSRALAVW